MEKDCVFCQIANHMAPAQIIYEDEEVVCFLDHDPINVGHVLVVPVKHYLDADELPASIACAIMRLSARVAGAVKEIFHPDGYSIMQDGGVFNDIGHYHMHVFPRYVGDGFHWAYRDDVLKYDASDTAAQIRSALESPWNCTKNVNGV